MKQLIRNLVRFSLLMLLVAVAMGTLASWAFLYPEYFNSFAPFYQLRPIHVSAALFWILSGAISGILFYRGEIIPDTVLPVKSEYVGRAFFWVWVITIATIFFCYIMKIFGGREYWEFPPVLSLPLLAAWILLMFYFFRGMAVAWKPMPQYLLMWITGIIFFLLTFIEQNLWNIPWFRESYVREMTVQWKANGSVVGAWNQMIYGTSLYLMVKLSNNQTLAFNRKSHFFYFVGFVNLIFNWGHHIYNVPYASWVRDISYGISMTEWVIFISIIQDFRSKISRESRHGHLLVYKFLMASEFWVLFNLLLALLMSVPMINRFTHGTHITVAHAMGTTIGINTMILLASMGYMLKIDEQSETVKKRINLFFAVAQVSLFIFWIALIVAGLLKGYRVVYLGMTDFQSAMQPVMTTLVVSSLAGLGLLVGLGTLAIIFLRMIPKRAQNEPEIFS